jgi:glycerophosphoryl diester phosphodiesterase
VPWTTSDAQRIRELIQAGVDGVCSNHPDVVVAPAETVQ